MLADIHAVCDYLILSACEAGETLSNLKLQKLLYYSQAWHLAIREEPLFSGKFQAWIHGPVNRVIYDRFFATKSLYSPILPSDVINTNPVAALSDSQKTLIDSVLEVYMPFTGTQLEEMTHGEAPWINARKGFSASQRCEKEIDEDSMKEFYSKQLV